MKFTSDETKRIRWELFKDLLVTRWQYRLLMVLCSLVAASTGLLAPLLQKRFMESLGPWPPLDIPYLNIDLHPLLFLGLSFFALSTSLILNQWVNRLGLFEAIHMNQKWGRAIYQKMLSLKPFDLSQKKPLGETIAVYTSDVPGSTILLEQSLPQALGILFPLILAPLVLIQVYDVPAGFLFVVLSLLLAINFSLALRQSTFFDRFKRLAAERVGLVSEWIQNIRVLRVMGWTTFFEKKIFTQRLIETKNRIQMLNNGQTMNAVSSSTAFLLNLALLTILTAATPLVSEQKMTPSTLLSLLWIVGIFLTRPFRQLPWFFTFIFDAWTSLKRLADLFAIQNQQPQILSSQFKNGKEALLLQVEGLCLQVGDNRLLKEVDLTIGKGEWVAIVGEVGAGKSLLLQSLLLETPATFANYAVANTAEPIAEWLSKNAMLVPQEGFLISANIRDNIGFSYNLPKDRDEELLNHLQRSQFSLENEVFSAGLDTMIGERGVNLSGGQKQRLGLARVQAFDREVVFFDDPFSALDVDTEDKVIAEVFRGVLKNKTRIMTTHRFSVLPHVDRILFMQEGRLVAQGTWDQLWSTHVEFRELIHKTEGLR